MFTFIYSRNRFDGINYAKNHQLEYKPDGITLCTKDASEYRFGCLPKTYNKNIIGYIVHVIIFVSYSI